MATDDRFTSAMLIPNCLKEEYYNYFPETSLGKQVENIMANATPEQMQADQMTTLRFRCSEEVANHFHEVAKDYIHLTASGFVRMELTKLILDKIANKEN